MDESPGQTAITFDGFAAALLSPTAAEAPPGVANPFGGEATKRFGVYHNNIAVGLKSALADIFPVTRDLVGERFFSAMAQAYISVEPPQSPVLAEYGQGFPAFIAGFAPARDLFFLQDVATLERIWLDAFHAADTAPIDADVLLGLPPEALMAARLEPRPAMAIRPFQSAAVDIFHRVRAGESLKGFDPSPPQTALVTRPFYDVEVRPLDGGEAVFVQMLARSCTIGEATQKALEVDPAFNPSTAFALILTSGAFAYISEQGGAK